MGGAPSSSAGVGSADAAASAPRKATVSFAVDVGASPSSAGLKRPSQALEEQRSGGNSGLFGKLFGKQRSSDEAIPQAKLLGIASAIPVSELINFLSSSRKTGILWVFGENETYLLELLDGSLVHATSDKTPPDMRLGEILVRKGLLRRSELKVLLRRARDAGEVFGTYLVSEARVSAQQLREVLAFQIQGLFDRLMNEGEAIYRFHEGEPLKCAAELDLNITQLLLESARFQDEAHKKFDEAA